MHIRYVHANHGGFFEGEMILYGLMGGFHYESWLSDKLAKNEIIASLATSKLIEQKEEHYPYGWIYDNENSPRYYDGEFWENLDEVELYELENRNDRSKDGHVIRPVRNMDIRQRCSFIVLLFFYE